MAETLKTLDYIVAFIDILGSKQRIKDDCDGSLNVVHNVYEESLALFGDLFKERVKFHVSIFSDNIVIATKVENEKLTNPVRAIYAPFTVEEINENEEIVRLRSERTLKRTLNSGLGPQ